MRNVPKSVSALATVALCAAGMASIADSRLGRGDCDVEDGSVECVATWVDYWGCLLEGTEICIEPCCSLGAALDAEMGRPDLDRYELERIIATAKGVPVDAWLEAMYPKSH